MCVCSHVHVCILTLLSPAGKKQEYLWSLREKPFQVLENEESKACRSYYRPLLEVQHSFVMHSPYKLPQSSLSETEFYSSYGLEFTLIVKEWYSVLIFLALKNLQCSRVSTATLPNKQ